MDTTLHFSKCSKKRETFALELFKLSFDGVDQPIECKCKKKSKVHLVALLKLEAKKKTNCEKRRTIEMLCVGLITGK